MRAGRQCQKHGTPSPKYPVLATWANTTTTNDGEPSESHRHFVRSKCSIPTPPKRLWPPYGRKRPAKIRDHDALLPPTAASARCKLRLRGQCEHAPIMKPAAVICIALCIVTMSGCGRDDEKLALADRKMCAAEAEHVFLSSGFRLAGGVMRVGGLESSGTFTSHYNARLRKCFIELFSRTFNRATREFTSSTVVSDAFEGTAYATYTEIWSGELVGPRVAECSLSLPNSRPTRCGTKAEWNALARPYVETATETP